MSFSEEPSCVRVLPRHEIGKSVKSTLNCDRSHCKTLIHRHINKNVTQAVSVLAAVCAGPLKTAWSLICASVSSLICRSTSCHFSHTLSPPLCFALKGGGTGTGVNALVKGWPPQQLLARFEHKTHSKQHQSCPPVAATNKEGQAF